MYTDRNFKTKKALREAVLAGDKVRVFQPGPFGKGLETGPKTVYLEGPHYPAPHTWYAEVQIDGEGNIVKVR